MVQRWCRDSYCVFCMRMVMDKKKMQKEKLEEKKREKREVLRRILLRVGRRKGRHGQELINK